LPLPKFIRVIAKKVQANLPFAIGKNEVYDRLTKEIIAKYCHTNAVCIDIGAHQGKILDWMIQYAPNAKHYAFEPIPFLYEKLKRKYADKAMIFSIALSDRISISSFNLVTTNNALSGLKKRPYPKFHEEQIIEVSTNLLDNIVRADEIIHLIKMDVEGGEWNVLKGSVKTITRCRPLILFECGKIGGELYGFTATEIYQFLTQNFDYEIYTLKKWLQQKKQVSFSEFVKYFDNGTEFFFLAVPKNIPKNS
jgi:FkbM family methyltransferase